MKTIAILSQKGGTGKTTLVLHLAKEAMSKSNKVAILDLDPQESSVIWTEAREENLNLDDFTAITSNERRLQKHLDTAKEHGADIVFIDTPPHTESSILAAARAADLVLVPVRPSGLDVDALHKTVNALSMVKVPSALVLNAVPPSRRNLPQTFADHFQDEYPALSLCPVTIFERAAYMDAAAYRKTAQELKPKGKEVTEMDALWNWTVSQLHK